MLILGIDDAGRGPLIGPMILAGVLVNEEHEKFLKAQGVRDSKTIFHPIRIKIAKIIKENSLKSKVMITHPEEIDNSINSGTNLNTLEAIKTAEIINSLNTGKEKMKIIVDCPSVNIPAWRKTLVSYIKNSDNLEIICEHKADVNHVSVSAASILAKCTREEEVKKLKEKYGDIGSGYPADPVTVRFLKKHGKELKDSGIFRKTWATWKALFPSKDQSTLKDF